jgi:predicted glutamine amidotransferase
LPADRDYLYNESVRKVADRNPKIVTAHVRKATSGCYAGVPNPHPFQRAKGGKNWLFAHNGVIGKDKLISLIGDEYLNNNLPKTCPDNPPDSWVGSELYFIFLLKNIEENGWDVQKGIKQALEILLSKVSGSDKGFNFFLSDGETIWAFRKGRPLYYYEQTQPRYSVVASRFPDANQGKWIEVPEGSLVIMRKDLPVELIQIYAPVA